MNITEDYVSYEVAKLLKEKGFEGDINAYYHIWDSGNNVWSVQEFNSSEAPHLYIPAPTHQIAMKWLREVHNLFICIEIGVKAYVWTITNTTDYVVVYIDVTVGTYEEALEAALKYLLENLIL